MVLLTRSIRRLRSAWFKPRFRMISEIWTISRPSCPRQRRYSRGFFFAEIVGQLFSQTVGGLVMLVQFVDAAGNVVDTLLQNLIGDFFFVEDHHVFDRAQSAFQVFAQRQHLLDHNRRARKRFQRSKLSALDALGNLHFLLAGEQRRSAHLAQVNPHRDHWPSRGTRSQVEFDFFAVLRNPLFQRGIWRMRLASTTSRPRVPMEPSKSSTSCGDAHILWQQIVYLVVCDVRFRVYQHRSVLSVVYRQVNASSGASVWAASIWREGNWLVYRGKFNRKRGIKPIFDPSTAGLRIPNSRKLSGWQAPDRECRGYFWSGRADLNRGPPAPKAGALPGCATPRLLNYK